MLFNNDKAKSEELAQQISDFVAKYSKPGTRGAVKSVSDDQPVLEYKINILYVTQDQWALNPTTFEKYLPGEFTQEEAEAALEAFCADYNLTLEHTEEGVLIKPADDTLVAPCDKIEVDDEHFGWACAGMAINFAVVNMYVDEYTGYVEISIPLATITIGSFVKELP